MFTQEIPERMKYWVEAEPVEIQVLDALPLFIDFYILIGTGLYLGLVYVGLKKLFGST